MSDMNRQYINPLTDFGFRHLFCDEKHRDFLKNLIEASFEGEKQISDIKRVATSGSRFSSQWLCTDADDKQFTVVIRLLNEHNFKSSSREFMSKFLTADFDSSEGAKQSNLSQENYLLGLLDVNPGGKEEPYYREINFIKNESADGAKRLLCFKLMDVVEFDKEEDELNTDLDKWFYVLKHLPELQTLPEFLQTPVFQSFFEAATFSSLDDNQKRGYEESIQRREVFIKNHTKETGPEETTYRRNDVGELFSGNGKRRSLSVFKLGYEIGYEDAKLDLVREGMLYR